MNIVARILNAISPVDPRVMECRQANVAQARLLVQAERDYWEAYMRKAATHADREYAMDHIWQLNRLERAS